MTTQKPRRLPPLQLEDYIALLKTLVVAAWIAAAGAIFTEVWVRHSALEWSQLGGFAQAYRALTVEFLATVSLLTVLLLRSDWYERVPRQSADRVRWLLLAVIVWFGLHVGGAFYLTGGLHGPMVALIPLLALAALVGLPGKAGWLTAAYLAAVPALTLLLEHNNWLQSPAPLTEAFRYAGADATPLGRAALAFALLFAVLLAIGLRSRTQPGGALFTGAELDPTTGLFHRAFLAQRLDSELARARRYGGDTTLLLLGLEGLGGNDSDPSRPDDRLRGVAQRLLGDVRLYSDTPTRYGLATLAVLLPTATQEGVSSVVLRMQESLRGQGQGLRMRLGACLVHDPQGVQATQVMERAEVALRSAPFDGAPVIVEAGR